MTLQTPIAPTITCGAINITKLRYLAGKTLQTIYNSLTNIISINVEKCETDSTQ